MDLGVVTGQANKVQEVFDEVVVDDEFRRSQGSEPDGGDRTGLKVRAATSGKEVVTGNKRFCWWWSPWTMKGTP